METYDIRAIVIIFIVIVGVLKARSWQNKRRTQSLIENMEGIEELKQLALATNTIGWVAGGKFGDDAEKYYFFALNSLSDKEYLLNKLPKYTTHNLKENAFESYKILKKEMKDKYTKEELEFSQTWAALKMLDVKNYMNGRSKKDIDENASYIWA
jgi:hypothetical protein